MSVPLRNNEVPNPSSIDGVPDSNPDEPFPMVNELLIRVAGLSEELITNHNPNLNTREVLLKISRIVGVYSEIERRIILGELTRTLQRLSSSEQTES